MSMSMSMTEIKNLAYDLCKRGVSLDQIENLRTYYLDARKKEQEEKRKAEQKNRATRIGTNFERGDATLADLSDVFYQVLCNYAPELPQDVKVNMTCPDACEELLEQIVTAYVDSGKGSAPKSIDELVNKLNSLLN